MPMSKVYSPPEAPPPGATPPVVIAEPGPSFPSARKEVLPIAATLGW